MIAHIVRGEFIFGKVALFWFVVTILGIASSQTSNTDNLLNTFSEEVSSSKQVLDRLALDIAVQKKLRVYYLHSINCYSTGSSTSLALPLLTSLTTSSTFSIIISASPIISLATLVPSSPKHSSIVSCKR